jgi:cytochrome c oxidase subunit II
MKDRPVMRNGYTLVGMILWTSLALSMSGCHRDHDQSMLHPAAEASAHIAWLWWVLFGICAAVFGGVMLLLWVAIGRRLPTSGDGASGDVATTHSSPIASGPRVPRSVSPLGDGFVIFSGIVFPAIVLLGILVLSVNSQVVLTQPETTRTVSVVGHMWWWEVRYPDDQIVTANEIYIPVGEPVRIELRSADVIHSLWVPNLQGKMDLLPDKTNVTWLQADRPGRYRGICAEYCGVQHAKMGLVVVALPRDEYDQWVARHHQPPIADQPELVSRGREVFFASTCHNCHAIEGTSAVGVRGPDLTHLGSRQTIGAGVLPNNRGNLIGWIANPQAIKPGNLMPRTHIAPDDLHALAAYLESLK